MVLCPRHSRLDHTLAIGIGERKVLDRWSNGCKDARPPARLASAA